VADPSDIITLQQAKDTLNITTTQYDTELPQYITAASVLWEMRVGPVAGSPTYDEFYNGGSPTIVVRHPPIQSVTSITESWGASTSYTLVNQVVDSGSNVGFYGYSVDLARGVFTRRASAVATQFAPGVQNIHIVYVAGFATTPADIVQAVALLTSHLWETQRGATRRPGMGGEDGYDPRASYTWPRRVQEIAASRYIPGIA